MTKQTVITFDNNAQVKITPEVFEVLCPEDKDGTNAITNIQFRKVLEHFPDDAIMCISDKGDSTLLRYGEMLAGFGDYSGPIELYREGTENVRLLCLYPYNETPECYSDIDM